MFWILHATFYLLFGYAYSNRFKYKEWVLSRLWLLPHSIVDSLNWPGNVLFHYLSSQPLTRNGPEVHAKPKYSKFKVTIGIHTVGRSPIESENFLAMNFTAFNWCESKLTVFDLSSYFQRQNLLDIFHFFSVILTSV